MLYVSSMVFSTMARKPNRSRMSRRKVLKTLGVGTGALALPTQLGRAASTEEQIPVPAGVTVPGSKVKSHPKAGDDLTGEGISNRLQSTEKTVTATGSLAPDHPSPASPSPNPDFDGWVADTNAALRNGREFKQLFGDWDCPARPNTFDPQTVHFFFPAFQNDGSRTMILQPVLAWNWGGYNDWRLASWWGPDSNGNYHHSNFINVNAGQKVNGYVVKMSGGASEWYINTRNEDTNQYTDLYTNRLNNGEFRYAYTTFETYNFAGSCSKKPGSCHFYNLLFSDVNGNGVNMNWGTWESSSFPCYVEPTAQSSETHIWL